MVVGELLDEDEVVAVAEEASVDNAVWLFSVNLRHYIKAFHFWDLEFRVC